MQSKKIWVASVVLAAVAAMGLSACSGTGKAPADTAAAPSTGFTFTVITHAAAGDTFWDVVKTGVNDAGKLTGDKVTYQGDGDVQKQAQLIRNAIAQKVDGIVVSMANPDGLKSALAEAKAAGIPFVTINSGATKSAEFGAITHIGQDEELAGEAVGTRLQDSGAKRAICVIHEAGNTGLEQRCAGIKKTFGGAIDNVQVNVNNIADAQNTIKSALLANTAIDTVVTLNPLVAIAGSAARDAASSSAKVATFDVSSDVVQQIQSGKIAFAVDQQQYLQGYLPIIVLDLFKRNGNTVGGGKPVYSGPGFVTKDNAADVAKYAKSGRR